MRLVLAVPVLLLALAVPSADEIRLTDASRLAAWLQSVAPAAGEPVGPLLQPGGSGATVRPRLVDFLANPSLGRDLSRRWAVPLAVVVGALGGVALGLMIGRRRRTRAEAATGPVAEESPPTTTPESSPRPAANALAQALAAIDMMEIETRTSLTHLGTMVGTLAEDVRLSPAGSREAPARVDAARGRITDVRGRFATARSALDGALADTTATRTEAGTAAARIHDVVAAAEAMDGAFQALIAAIDAMAWLPRLFDDLELRAGAGAGEALAPAIARARQLALGRIDALDRAKAALTEGVVRVEESLVALDEAGARLASRAEAAGEGEAAAALDAFDGDLALAEAALDDARRSLAPLDVHADRIAARVADVRRIAGQSLERLKTILGPFVRHEERRRFRRVPTRLAARILIDGAWAECVVVNISMGGAAIEGELAVQPGTSGQIAFTDWDTLLPLVVTGTSPGRTHLFFQLNDTLARSLIGYVEVLLAA